MPHHISGRGSPSTLGFDGPTVPDSGEKAPRGSTGKEGGTGPRISRAWGRLSARLQNQQPW